MNKKGRDETPCLKVLRGFPWCRYAYIRETLFESRENSLFLIITFGGRKLEALSRHMVYFISVEVT
jgi:hypothetical protein